MLGEELLNTFDCWEVSCRFEL